MADALQGSGGTPVNETKQKLSALRESGAAYEGMKDYITGDNAPVLSYEYNPYVPQPIVVDPSSIAAGGSNPVVAVPVSAVGEGDPSNGGTNVSGNAMSGLTGGYTSFGDMFDGGGPGATANGLGPFGGAGPTPTDPNAYNYGGEVDGYRNGGRIPEEEEQYATMAPLAKTMVVEAPPPQRLREGDAQVNNESPWYSDVAMQLGSAAAGTAMTKGLATAVGVAFPPAAPLMTALGMLPFNKGGKVCPCGTPGCPGCGKGYNEGGSPWQDFKKRWDFEKAGAKERWAQEKEGFNKYFIDSAKERWAQEKAGAKKRWAQEKKGWNEYFYPTHIVPRLESVGRGVMLQKGYNEGGSPSLSDDYFQGVMRPTYDARFINASNSTDVYPPSYHRGLQYNKDKDDITMKYHRGTHMFKDDTYAGGASGPLAMAERNAQYAKYVDDINALKEQGGDAQKNRTYGQTYRADSSFAKKPSVDSSFGQMVTGYKEQVPEKNWYQSKKSYKEEIARNESDAKIKREDGRALIDIAMKMKGPLQGE
tara:strand:+ start:1578 stop:3179 length:1602 start_codon:yes stop_codon:yes gene_type:complete